MELWTGVLSWRNATEPIWRVLTSSDGISCWTLLKPQHSNLKPNPLANQLWCINFLTPPTTLIIPHRLPAFLNLLCNSNTDARFMQNSRKAVWSIPYVSVAFFQVYDRIVLLIVLLKSPHIQIAFLKFSSCDNQTVAECIPIAAVAVHLNLKS